MNTNDYQQALFNAAKQITATVHSEIASANLIYLAIQAVQEATELSGDELKKNLKLVLVSVKANHDLKCKEMGLSENQTAVYWGHLKNSITLFITGEEDKSDFPSDDNVAYMLSRGAAPVDVFGDEKPGDDAPMPMATGG